MVPPPAFKTVPPLASPPPPGNTGPKGGPHGVSDGNHQPAGRRIGPPALPDVALPERALGPLALLRRARRNTVSVIPAALLDAASWRGRTIWRWAAFADPDAARHILLRAARTFPNATFVKRMLRPAVAHSLLLCPDAEHGWQRRTAQRRLAARACPGHADTIRRAIARADRDMPADARPRIDALDRARTITMRTILQITCSAGESFDIARFQRGFEGYLDSVARLGPLDLLNLPPAIAATLRPGPARMLADLRSQIGGLVDDRLAGRTTGDDMLADLVAARHPETGRALRPAELRDNILLMIVAGHETTSHALAWACHLLALHPGIQDRARAEIRAADPIADNQVLKATPFLGAILDETLRLYPSVPLLIRSAREADTVAGCPVSRHGFAMVPIWAMHRSHRHWEDPEAFRPDRFGTRAAPRHPAFMPFSVGPRSCIGASFALYEARMVLADLLRRFRLHPVPGRAPAPVGTLTLQAAGGVGLELERL